MPLRDGKDAMLRFLDGAMQVRYKDRILPCTAFKSHSVPSPAEDEKTIDARVDAAIARLAAQAAQAVAPQGCG